MIHPRLGVPRRLTGIAAALVCLALCTAPAQAQPVAPPAATASAPAAKAAPTAAPSGIYRWKDANGKVHFGDRAPPNAERVQVRDDTPSPEAVRAAQERVQAMQQRSDELAAQRRAQTAPADAPAEGAVSEGEAAPRNESACQAQWRAYHESYACFNPYRQANGSVKAEAFKHCKSVTRPSCSPS